MARFFQDEHLSYKTADQLRAMGHDVLMTEDAGRKSLKDFDQLTFCTGENRIMITINRKDFMMHDTYWPHHKGIISIKELIPEEARARYLDAIVQEHASLEGSHVRANRDDYTIIDREGKWTKYEYSFNEGKEKSQRASPLGVAQSTEEITPPLPSSVRASRTR